MTHPWQQTAEYQDGLKDWDKTNPYDRETEFDEYSLWQRGSREGRVRDVLFRRKMDRRDQSRYCSRRASRKKILKHRARKRQRRKTLRSQRGLV